MCFYYRCHYPGTLTNSLAVQTGKPLWASEDYSTFNDLVGGGCWARVRDGLVSMMISVKQCILTKQI